MGVDLRRAGRWALAIALLLTAPTAAFAALADGPYAKMKTKLEVGPFGTDVLTLDIRLGEAARDRVAAQRGDAEAVTAAVIGAEELLVRLDFHRSLDTDRLVEAVRDNVDVARRAGLVADAPRVSRELAGWLAFLGDRGTKDGDELAYRIVGQRVRLTYRDRRGRVLRDATYTVDHPVRRALIGGYLAERSEFRAPLMRSLLRSGGYARG